MDLLKIMPSGGVLDESASVDNAQMTIEEIKAVVTAAHDYGYTVAAHAHGAEAIRRAVLAGVDSIEHGTFMNDEDRVIGLMAGKTAKAFPAGILSQHGLVEDQSPKGPIAITW